MGRVNYENKTIKSFSTQLEHLKNCSKKEEYASWSAFIDSEDFKQCYMDEECCHEFTRFINRYVGGKKTLDYLVKKLDEAGKSIKESQSVNFNAEDVMSRIMHIKSECMQNLKYYKTKKKKKITAFVVLAAILFGVVLPVAKYMYDNQPIKFQDEKMGRVLCIAVEGKKVNPGSVTYDDLRTVETLNIARLDFYSSISDIKYCTSLKALRFYDVVNGSNVKCDLTNEDVERIGRELNEIIPNLPNLETLELGSNARWNTVDFMKYCKKLEHAYIYNNEATDYSALNECDSLEYLLLENCSFSKVDDISEMKKLSDLSLENVPVMENEDELEKLSKIKGITSLSLNDGDDYQLVSLNPFRNNNTLEYIALKNCHLTDYSALKNCENLESVYLGYSQISKADDIIGMKNIKNIYIENTPLAQNPDELNKLKEAYPGAVISY